MKTIFRTGIVAFVTAAAILSPSSPVLAGGPPDAQIAVTQGSSVPGFAVPSADTATNKRRDPVEITFTKWITTYPELAGVTRGDVRGIFAGEVLRFLSTTTTSLNTSISLVEAVYEVQAGHRTFTALVKGGQTGDTEKALGEAILDGVILAGWRTGAQVHVKFKKVASCAGKPAGPCFEGTIEIEQDTEK